MIDVKSSKTVAFYVIVQCRGSDAHSDVNRSINQQQRNNNNYDDDGVQYRNDVVSCVERGDGGVDFGGRGFGGSRGVNDGKCK